MESELLRKECSDQSGQLRGTVLADSCLSTSESLGQLRTYANAGA